jgi:hypothetical protein
MADPLLTKTQRKELVSQLLTGGVKRTTVGSLTTEFNAPSTTDILRILAEDAATSRTSRPFRIQVQRSPGSIY